MTAEPHRPLDLALDRADRRDAEPYAIVDIGSNSVRLVVYDAIGRAPFPRFNEKSLCRLAEGLEETGVLAQDRFDCAVEAVGRFRAIARAMGATRIDAIATEATRRATNGSRLVSAIAEQAGLSVRVLSGQEEATLAALGVISGFFRPVGRVGDMGGGSLELADVVDDQVGSGCVSLPLGALPVRARMARDGAGAKAAIDELLAAKVKPAATNRTFYAVGGGWRAFAKAYMTATNSPVRVVHGLAVEADAIRSFAKSIWKGGSPASAGGRVAGVSSRRQTTLPAAALVLDRVLKHLGSDRVIFSALGVREGWLFGQLPETERYLDPLVEGAQAYGLPFARVPSFGPALTRWTSRIEPGEAPTQRRLRVAACALSDMAWRDHEDCRAVESFRRLLQFPFIGISHPERVFLATALHARYAGRADDPILAPASSLLPPEDLRRARILGLAMLLAYRLSGSAPDILDQSELVIAPRRILLRVAPAAHAPDSEVVMDRLRLLAGAVGAPDVAIEEADPSVST